MHHVRYVYFFFFFSSRRRHTRCSRDWSSDVCSSDLFEGGGGFVLQAPVGVADEFARSGFQLLVQFPVQPFKSRLHGLTTELLDFSSPGKKGLELSARCPKEVRQTAGRGAVCSRRLIFRRI